MQIDQLPRALCHSLLRRMQEGGLEHVPANDSRVDALFGDVLEIVEDQCRQALAAGNNEFVDECLYVLDKLGPDAATGRHDLFWAKVRELQPGSLSFRNPTYKTASLAEHVTEDPTYELSDHWKTIINLSAEKLFATLRR